MRARGDRIERLCRDSGCFTLFSISESRLPLRHFEGLDRIGSALTPLAESLHVTKFLRARCDWFV
jgi:hypothetical protein